MRQTNPQWRSFFIIMLAVICISVLWPRSSLSFSDQILEVGARGDDVYELQGRLSFLGFYHDKIDGQFGWKTYWSVRNFQYEFGIRVDGVAGPQTKLKLWEATKSWRPGANQSTKVNKPANRPATVHSFSENDKMLLARAVYSEARGEPYEGQVAVVAVILNRLNSPLFPNTVSGVIFQPGAFTAVDDGQYWGLEPNHTAYRAVNDALNGWNPIDSALYYFNPDTATSAWIWSRQQIKRIGKHIYCI